MTIDEAIAKYKEIANTGENCPAHCKISCDKCVQESQQIAEWLEDYKRIKMLIPIEQALKNEYNKAIDDFKKMLTIEKIKEYAESDGFINLNNCNLMIFDIAEKLKAGGKNG